MKLMIVDDAMFMRMIIEKIVEGSEFEVVAQAENGSKAVELYNMHEPDIVTMDITMPELDGIGAVTEIMAKHPNAKIIMASAMGQQGMVIDAIKAGAKDFLVKPFDKEKVLETLRKHTN